MKNPFENLNGELEFPWQPTLDRAFLYPFPLPKKYGNGLIEIPEAHQEFYKGSKAILLAVGPGFFDKKGKWIPVTDQLKPGQIVCFDNTIPWEYKLKGNDGNMYTVFLCGVNDIYGVFDE